MRILINGWALSNRGGIGRYTRNLILALAQTKIFDDVVFVVPNKIAGVNQDSIIINQTRTNRIWYEYVTLPAICAKVKPDIVLCPDFLTCHYAKAKIVTVIHDLSPILLPQTVSWRARLLFKNGIIHTIKTADLILADSKFTQQTIFHTFNRIKSKVEVLYPALESIFLEQPEPLSFQSRNQEIIWVGDSGLRKDIGTLINSIEIVVTKEPEYKLVYVGPINESLKQRPWIMHKQNISDEELIQLYRQSKCLVSTSILEGFGYPVAEALSQGTPCVVTKDTSMPEILNIGISVFSKGNPQECANQILQIIKSSEIKPDELASSLRQKGYDYSSYINRLRSLLISLF